MDKEIKEYLEKLIEKQTEEIKKYIDEKIELLEAAIEDISCEADSGEVHWYAKRRIVDFLDDFFLSDSDAVCKLNELAQAGFIRKSPEYEYSEIEEGWMCKCSVENINASGTGESKKDAKKNVSKKILIELLKNGTFEIPDAAKAKYIEVLEK